MKRYLLLTGLLLFGYLSLLAQNRPYNVVFDLTSKDTNDQKAVIRWVSAISQSDPAAKLEVVLYGQSLDMVVKDRSVAADAVQKLANTKNVSFKVCNMAMKHHNLDKSQLISGVDIVPDGIYEIVTKQGEGWGYIKASH